MRIAAGLVFVLLSTGAIAAGSRLATEDCNFGETYAFNRAECEFTFTNAGDTPIHVSDFQPVRPGDSIEPSAAVIAPHAKAYLKAVVDTGNDIATSRHIFHFRSDESGHEDRVVAARGFALSVLDQGRPMIDLGVVELAKDLPSHKIELTSHDVADFRVTKIESAPPYLDVQFGADGQSVTLKMRANAPWGYQGDYIKLNTNSTLQKQVWIGVQSNIHGDVVPAANPFNMGLMRKGNRNEVLIRLTSKSGKNFAVGPIELEKLHGKTVIEPCQPVADGCRMIRLRISDEQPIGSVVGKLMVELPGYSQRLLIAVNGLFLTKDTKIEKLDPAELLRAQDQKKAQSSAAGAEIDISKALKGVVQSADDLPPAGSGPLVKWSVMNEAALYGYQIFRATDENGPFVLINRPAIPVKKHDNTGSTYQWRDDTAVSGKTYWYFIGLLYSDGHKQQLTGPQKVVAK